jgi:hypothetical protein
MGKSHPTIYQIFYLNIFLKTICDFKTFYFRTFRNMLIGNMLVLTLVLAMQLPKLSEIYTHIHTIKKKQTIHKIPVNITQK